ncbi:hypothetical protein CBA19CS11_29845 [Caballeronia novacaledonica]|uniref:hypothetical protein n=1 Tax=Caballeronia novacaledonica TaxID=1544861 RepID=UPI001EE36D66|nr:hypothetical protein [Caballeronia novacaledonica]GJH13129.1 hypothetical protein CBA19CS11_29845 [Caballeronia novacaledonica]
MYVFTPELAHSARTLPAFVQQSAQQRRKEFGELEVATIFRAVATIELSSRLTSSLTLLLEFHCREPDKALIFAPVVAHRPSLRDSTGQPGAPDPQFTISGARSASPRMSSSTRRLRRLAIAPVSGALDVVRQLRQP